MELNYYKQLITQNEQSTNVIIWKFKDYNGNIFVSETDITGTEEQARKIILKALETPNNA